MMTHNLDNKSSCNTMLSTYLTMGARPPPFPPLLVAHAKPSHLCGIMLRMMFLRAAMHLWELCTEVRGDSGGRAMQSAIVGDVVIVVVNGGECGRGRHTVKTPN